MTAASPRASTAAFLVGVGVAIVLLVASQVLVVPVPSKVPLAPGFAVYNESAALGPVYDPGVILGAASNGTETLLGGIGVYVKVPEFTLPGLASLEGPASSPSVTNLTPAVNTEFWEGGVYAMGWNGTAWLIGGQAGWGGGSNNFGALVRLQSGGFVNETDLLGGAFNGGGVFAMGWNGTSWLFGGNSTQGPVLISLHGTRVTNLTSEIRGWDPWNYIQTLDWNGQEWLVGGEGVFGLLQGNTFTDLWSQSPYAGAGVYAAGWDGSEWLAGGGAGRLVLVDGDTVHAVPPLGDHFDQSVTFVSRIAQGWLIGGTGTSSAGAFAPELVFWNGEGSSSTTVDLTPELPSAFTGGDLQSGCEVPAFGADSFLVVGEGDYNNDTGFGVGALALVTVLPSSA